jgi:hypothetical protein
VTNMGKFENLLLLKMVYGLCQKGYRMANTNSITWRA